MQQDSIESNSQYDNILTQAKLNWNWAHSLSWKPNWFRMPTFEVATITKQSNWLKRWIFQTSMPQFTIICSDTLGRGGIQLNLQCTHSRPTGGTKCQLKPQQRCIFVWHLHINLNLHLMSWTGHRFNSNRWQNSQIPPAPPIQFNWHLIQAKLYFKNRS